MALQIVQEAFAQGRLKEGGLITEGTAGSTGLFVGMYEPLPLCIYNAVIPAGISLAMVAAAYGCRCFIAMPDDAAAEKANMLQVNLFGRH